MNVLVLAGGEGRRLRPILGRRAKVLAQIAGKPFLSHLLSHVRSQGIQRVVLALGYFHEQVLHYLKERSCEGLEIISIIENRPLGTAGAIRNALSALRSDPVFVMNGDTYTEVLLQSLLAFHRERLATATLAAAWNRSNTRYGQIEMDKTGRVVRFVEKGRDDSGYVNSGVYVVSRQIIETIPSDRAVSWEREVLPRLVGKGLFAYRGSFRFLDIGTPASYRKAAKFLEEK
ncbi:sugar phosphate nucleotidyltransferase [Acidobacteria bacterium AH-259-A15]|nr:sugar phosphate nucleotidyltransferase [Acidobacteria bacterium AH-259-A15]